MLYANASIKESDQNISIFLRDIRFTTKLRFVNLYFLQSISSQRLEQYEQQLMSLSMNNARLNEENDN